MLLCFIYFDAAEIKDTTTTTAEIQLKILGRCFGSHVVPLPTLKAYVVLGLKPWCKKRRKLGQDLGKF